MVGIQFMCIMVNDRDWEQLGEFDILNVIAPTRYDDSFGHAVSLTSFIAENDETGYRVAIGAPGKNSGGELNSGMVAVYEYLDTSSSGEWSLVGSAVAPENPGEGHQFGYSLDVNGDILAVGIPGWQDNLGQVSLYQLAPGETHQHWKIHPTMDSAMLRGTGNSDYGFSVRFVSKETQGPWTLVVGSPVTNGDLPGNVHVFEVE